MTAPQEPYDPFRKEGAGAGGSVPIGEPGTGSPQPGGQPPPFGPPPPQYGQPGGYGPPAGGPPGYGPGYGTPPVGQYGSPFGQPGGPQLASWGLRVGGALIDGVITGVVGAVLTLISADLGNVVQFVLFLVFGYLTGTTGQTPGRRIVGITVLREHDGQHLGAGAGIARSFLHILDALPLFLGYLWPIWDAKKQTFADKIIKSVVVKV